MCGTSSTCYNNNDSRWYMPSFTMDFVEKGCVFYGFVFDFFGSKSIISVCKFYELYFEGEVVKFHYVGFLGHKVCLV